MDIAKILELGTDISVTDARTLIANGEVVKAVTGLISCVSKDPANHEALCLLGDVYAMGGQSMQAVESYGQAVMVMPSNRAYRQKLIDVTSSVTFKKMNPNLKGVLTECLESGGVDWTHFGKAWLSVIAADQPVASYYRLAKHSNFNAFEKSMSKFPNLDGLIDPFFLFGLGQFIVPNLEFERWFTYLRRYVLKAVISEKTIFSDEDDIELLSCAMLKYSYFTDYVFAVSSDESIMIDTLRDEIGAGGAPSLSRLAILGCYEPLALLPNAKAIASDLVGGEHVSQIPKAQIEDYFKQQAIKKDIKVLTDIDDDVSQSVREQYEAFPYPRWVEASRDLFNARTEGALLGANARVLIAGCGTGKEAVQMAYALPDAQITAVDLSQSSLAYAVFKSEELGIENITFMQGDIMKLGDAFDERFDYIASAGVLHHMKDPKAGWKVLDGLLKPKGLMRIALYSSHSRWAVNFARGVIAEKNIGNDAQSIREFRQNISTYLKYKYIKNLEGFYDYYSLPECRDLLFHVQERDYNLLEIKEILDEFGLEFLEFHIQNEVVAKYKKHNPDDTDARDLTKWAAWQDKNPTTVLPMHSFWCQKL